MAGSNKTERNRQLKQNRAAGIGDETGRIPVRVKEAGTMLTCTGKSAYDFVYSI